MEWMTVKEAGEIWGVSARRATILCVNHKVADAQKLGRQWVIPKGTIKPIDGRTKAAKALNGKEYLGRVTAATLSNPVMGRCAGMLSIEEIKSYVIPVIEKYPIDRVILFGSHARGDAIDSSDVDLVVDSRGRLRNRKIFALGGELLSALPVRVDVYDILEIANPSAMYDNILKEGVIIYDATR